MFVAAVCAGNLCLDLDGAFYYLPGICYCIKGIVYAINAMEQVELFCKEISSIEDLNSFEQRCGDNLKLEQRSSSVFYSWAYLSFRISALVFLIQKYPGAVVVDGPVHISALLPSDGSVADRSVYLSSDLLLQSAVRDGMLVLRLARLLPTVCAPVLLGANGERQKRRHHVCEMK